MCPVPTTSAQGPHVCTVSTDYPYPHVYACTSRVHTYLGGGGGRGMRGTGLNTTPAALAQKKSPSCGLVLPGVRACVPFEGWGGGGRHWVAVPAGGFGGWHKASVSVWGFGGGGSRVLEGTVHGAGGGGGHHKRLSVPGAQRSLNAGMPMRTPDTGAARPKEGGLPRAEKALSVLAACAPLPPDPSHTHLPTGAQRQTLIPAPRSTGAAAATLDLQPTPIIPLPTHPLRPEGCTCAYIWALCTSVMYAYTRIVSTDHTYPRAYADQGFHSNHAQTARFNIPISYIAAITISSVFMCGPTHTHTHTRAYTYTCMRVHSRFRTYLLIPCPSPEPLACACQAGSPRAAEGAEATPRRRFPPAAPGLPMVGGP